MTAAHQLARAELRPGLLALRRAGADAGPCLVLLHGFLADGRSWAGLADDLLAAWPGPLRLLCPDLPGHGASVAAFPAGADDAARWHDLGRLLAATVAAWTPDPPLVYGYSMGARMAAALAQWGHLALAGLVLESGHPGVDGSAAQARRIQDEMRAGQMLAQGLPAFVDAWAALPLFASQQRLVAEAAPRLAAQHRLRLAQDPAGLARNLRELGTGTMPHVAAASPRPDLPALLLAGAEDTACVERLPIWQGWLPAATTLVVAGAGHNVHLERPAAVVGTLTAWLARRAAAART